MEQFLETLSHSLWHPLIDTLKMSPIIFLAYLFMEWLEHNGSEKLASRLKNSKRFGPLWASILGLIPQCGFSGAVASMYATGTVSLGALLAVIISTSDEMLPVMLGRVSAVVIISILAFKLVVGVTVGFVTDFILKRFGRHEEEHIHEFCEQERCSCKDGIWVSALKHTLKILAIIYIITVIIDFTVELVPREALVDALNFPVLSQIASALFGLIPSCAVSATLSQLYIDGALGISSLLCGLLTNGGVGLLVLFRVNRNLKSNILIALTVFATGLIFGSVAGLFF